MHLPAAALPNQGGATLQEVAAAINAGAEKIVLYGGAKEGSRTMLDALLPAAKALTRSVKAGLQRLIID